MNITITGPRSVGKSTISQLLAEELGYKYIETDAVMNEKLKDLGGLNRAIKDKKAEVIMNLGSDIVKEALKDDRVALDLAGGAISSSKGTSMGVCQQIITTINQHSFVVGLLPFEDDEKSTQLLLEREQQRDHFKDTPLYQLRYKTYRDYYRLKPILQEISDAIIHVGGKSPSPIIEEIQEEISRSP